MVSGKISSITLLVVLLCICGFNASRAADEAASTSDEAPPPSGDAIKLPHFDIVKIPAAI